jgi:hypothetical protein
VLVGLLMVAGLNGPAAADGPWVWPLDGARTVSRPFDPPATRYGPGHRGADLPGRPGQAVRATGAGRISYAGLLAGRGIVVVVHRDLRSTYEPVTPLVRVGGQVAAGDVIGRLAPGHAGCPGTCLHWGLLRGAVYLDPVRLVRAGLSRLLPLDRGPVLSPVLPADAPAARTDVAAPAASPQALTATPAPAAEPAFALRAGDTAWGAGAMAALVAGLLLLRRPRRPPDGPVTPSHPVVHALDHAPAVVVGPQSVAGLVDLAAERHRRRPEVA